MADRRRRRRGVVVLGLVGALGAGAAAVWAVRRRRAPNPWPAATAVPDPAPAPGAGADPRPDGVDSPTVRLPTVAPRAVTEAPVRGTGPAPLFSPATPAHGEGFGPTGDEPYGPGSAAPLPDGSPPGPEYTIKGNASSMLFHPPSSPYYGRTKPEAWFRTAEDARRAGFTEWKPRPRSG